MSGSSWGRAAFRRAARDQRVCAVSGRGGAFQAHHVVALQTVKLYGGYPWDPRNALRISPEVHEGHHRTGVNDTRIPLSALTDRNIEYAYSLMGAAADLYLWAHYRGSDARVPERSAA